MVSNYPTSGLTLTGLTLRDTTELEFGLPLVSFFFSSVFFSFFYRSALKKELPFLQLTKRVSVCELLLVYFGDFTED